MTRWERRAVRQRRFVANKEAHLAARLARLDYKVTNESGALRAPTHSLTWHLGTRLNGSSPPPGQGWGRSGAAHVVGAHEVMFTQPISHREWRRLIATKAQEKTNK